MIQAGESAFPRSAAGIVALYRAGIYEGEEITEGLEYLMALSAAGRRIQPRHATILRPLLCRAGDVACRRRARKGGTRPSATHALGKSTGRRGSWKTDPHGDHVHDAMATSFCKCRHSVPTFQQ